MTSRPTQRSEVTTETYDVALATTLATCGLTPELEDRQGRVLFRFKGDAEKLRILESTFWDGSLQCAARELLLNHKLLKARLYSMKDSRR